MSTLLPQPEGVEELVVDALHDLADTSDPPPKAFGPYLQGVAFGWTDKPRPLALKPPEVVFGTLEALVGDIGSRRKWAYAREPSVRRGSQGKEGLRRLLVGVKGSTEAKARNDPIWIDGGEQTEALISPQAVRPSDVSVEPASQPAPLRLASRTGIAELSSAS